MGWAYKPITFRATPGQIDIAKGHLQRGNTPPTDRSYVINNQFGVNEGNMPPSGLVMSREEIGAYMILFEHDEGALPGNPTDCKVHAFMPEGKVGGMEALMGIVRRTFEGVGSREIED